MATDGEDEIAASVYNEIEEAGFDVPMVELLLDEATEGQIDLMGDVLIHLVNKQHADWAAELCRMLINREGSTKPEPDYHVLTSVLHYMVDMQQLDAAREVCCFILVLKDNDQGVSFFDCTDLAMLLGNMVHHQHSKQAAEIVYAFYCDDSSEGRMYHAGIPYILGTLVDQQKSQWAVELTKQLMLNDDEYGAEPTDYTVVGWILGQMVVAGRADWAAKICEGLKAERLPWFQMPQLLDSVASWSDYSHSQAIAALMGDIPGPRGFMHPAQRSIPHMHQQQQQWSQAMGVGPYDASPMMPAMPYGRQPVMAPGRQQHRGGGPSANGQTPAQLANEMALLRNEIEARKLQQCIQQMEARGGQASSGVASLNASMQGMSLQQQQQRQQGAAANGSTPVRSLQAAVNAQPFVPRGVHAPPFVPRGSS